jgi:hypothetical protein
VEDTLDGVRHAPYARDGFLAQPATEQDRDARRTLGDERTHWYDEILLSPQDMALSAEHLAVHSRREGLEGLDGHQPAVDIEAMISDPVEFLDTVGFLVGLVDGVEVVLEEADLAGKDEEEQRDRRKQDEPQLEVERAW